MRRGGIDEARKRRDAIGVLALAALVCAAMSAHAALRAIDHHAVVSVASRFLPPSVATDISRPAAEPQASVSGNALPAPAPGVTGTIALPDLPAPPDAASYIGDASIHPAAPFSLKGIAPLDRSRALQCLTAAIYYEAATEPDAGQQAVAQVVLNRVRHSAFPNTVCGVVYQGSEHAGCQFSFACDGAATRAPQPAYWIRAARVAVAALNGRVFAPVGLATHYHTYAVTPAWNRGLVMTAAIGAHFFHRWQGWWGTPAAFRRIYAGHEPLPAPHPRDDLPVAVAPVVTIPPAPPAPKITQTATIQPAYADSGKPLAADRSDDSQILDRWKDSGKPLR